jgi:hypothetical protein
MLRAAGPVQITRRFLPLPHPPLVIRGHENEASPIPGASTTFGIHLV